MPPVRRSTLADANKARDWRIYAELAQRLIAQARRLYANEDLGFDLANTVYALDSTTIDLCLAVFTRHKLPILWHYVNAKFQPCPSKTTGCRPPTAANCRRSIKQSLLTTRCGRSSEARRGVAAESPLM
jgi:hypothetical protein